MLLVDQNLPILFCSKRERR